MNARLDAREVSVVRGGRRILDSASVVIPPGAFTAIVGPNGSGKSTLLRVLAGLWTAESGSATLDGRPIGAMPRRELARRLAFLPQDTRCDFAFTVPCASVYWFCSERPTSGPTSPGPFRATFATVREP